MYWLNYNHLYYFWTFVREGSVERAARALRLSQPAVSAQLKVFEEQSGAELFAKSGRAKVLTDFGRLVYQHAEEIFTAGRELQELLRTHSESQRTRLRVGIVDALPKLICTHLLEPALNLDPPARIECFEGKAPQLLAQLSLHELDLVLSDSALGGDVSIKAYNHFLGECGILILGPRDLAMRVRRRFPKSLNDAPLLLPTQNTALRRELDLWFEENDITPQIAGEFEDSALLKTFAQHGWGLCIIPSVVEKEVKRQYQLVRAGQVPEITERFYAISLERRVRHPGVAAVTESARSELFRC